jgi:hypothetical protein
LSTHPPTFWLPHQYPICISVFSHACYMPCPSHPTWLDHSNYVWWGVQVMKLLIMQFSPLSCHFVPVRTKYSPQHPVSLAYPLILKWRQQVSLKRRQINQTTERHIPEDSNLHSYCHKNLNSHLVIFSADMLFCEQNFKPFLGCESARALFHAVLQRLSIFHHQSV